MFTVHLASPLGFSHEWTSYRDKIKQRLTQMGCRVLDPWEQTYHSAIQEAGAIRDWPARVQAFMQIAAGIGENQ